MLQTFNESTFKKYCAVCKVCTQCKDSLLKKATGNSDNTLTLLPSCSFLGDLSWTKRRKLGILHLLAF